MWEKSKVSYCKTTINAHGNPLSKSDTHTKTYRLTGRAQEE